MSDVAKSTQQFVIFGHRGCIGVDGIGENTVPAVERALRDGADGIEFDVYTVLDVKGAEHLIVMHDDDVERTTNGKGKVGGLGYEQLRALKVGDERTETADEYAEMIPTAAEILDAIATFDAATGKHTLINIELKGMGTASPSATLIHAHIKRGLTIDQFIVSSFDHSQLIQFHELMPDVKTAVLIHEQQYEAAGNTLNDAIRLAEQLQSVAVNPGISFTSKQDVEAVHRHSLKAYVWTDAPEGTTDETSEHAKLIRALGADGMFANNPEAA